MSWNGTLWAPRSLVFGDNFTSAESLGTSTTSSTWTQKLRLTTPSVPAGDYNIMWSFTWHSDGNRFFQYRVQLDDATDLMYLLGAYQATTYVRNPAAGSAVATLSAASHTFDLDFGNYYGTYGNIYVSMARLAFWRLT